jgi:uncharacterized LabA/DUF88 family protein
VTKLQKILKLKGKTAVFIDWANVHGWEESGRFKVNLKKLFKYLKGYEEIKSISLYFGKDTHPKSRKFLSEAMKTGFEVITKPVKYIRVAEFQKKPIFRRKCDFDIEICIDVHKYLNQNYDGFIFFSGDGDFAPLYRLLNNNRKQIIVVYSKGHIGKEVWDFGAGLFKIQYKNLGL